MSAKAKKKVKEPVKMTNAEVFKCEGTMGIVEEPSVFTFKIFTDGSLTVHVTSNDFLDTKCTVLSDATSAIDVTSSEHDDMSSDRSSNGEERSSMDLSSLETSRRSRQTTKFGYFAFDGRASLVMNTSSDNVRVFSCQFKLIKLSRVYETKAMSCAARISQTTGSYGKWINLDFSPESEWGTFLLKPLSSRIVITHDSTEADPAPKQVPYQVERLNDQLFPLTEGQYILKGCAIAENGSVYESILTLKFLAGGLLTGTCREICHTQSCKIEGKWTRDDIEFSMSLETGNRISTYVYLGSPLYGILRGGWQNADLLKQNYKAERGVFEYEVLQADRQWCLQNHHEYPQAFKLVVKSVVQSSDAAGIASSSLPTVAWCQVFSYCGYNWFHDETQEQEERSP